MLPITDFLSCTDPLDEFDSLSHHQTQHAKTYVTGLAAGGSKTVTGIAREVLPAGSDRALNKFITEYDWDEDELNHERLEELQNHGETRWSTDGYIVIDDSVLQRTGKELPGAGSFYDHSEGEPVWGQDLVYAFYTDHKTSKEYLTPAIISKRQIENEQFLFSESDSEKYFLDLHDLTIDIINEVENSSIVGDELQSQVNEEVIEERLKEYLRENGDGGLADYIEHGKSEYINFDDPNDNIHGRGETWWDLGDLAGPRLVMIETRQHRPGVLWNEDQIPVKDTGRPFYAESGLESDEKVIAGILNSSIGRIFIESHGRISGGSAIRMMVYDLKSLPMLDLDQMSNDVKTEISSAFEKWIKADTHSDFDENLDRAVLSAFDEFEENSDNEDGNGENWESRWETFQDKAERMKEIRNDSREVKLLLDDEEGEELENVVDSGAKVNKTLDDF